MADISINVEVVGASQASSDIRTVGSSLDDAGNKAKTAGSNFSAIGKGLSEAVRGAAEVSAGIIGLVSSYTNLERAQLAVDKANKTILTSQAKLTSAQDAYNKAVSQYGENSKQANDAALKVKAATEGLANAQESARLKQTGLNEQFAEFATNIAPQILTVGSGIKDVFQALGSSGIIGKIQSAIGGVGSAATVAAPAAKGLTSEVIQLGTGIAAGVAPLAGFGGAIGGAGTAAEAAAGGIEAAAGAAAGIETSAAAGEAASVGLATGIVGVSAATAAETAGLSLAVAALILYATNIGGFRDKTNAAAQSARDFLAIGWSGFAERFKPVTDAIQGGVKAFEDLIAKAGEAAKLDVSGQFKKQTLPPGQQPGPSGRPLDTDIAGENAVVAKGTAGLLAMVDAAKQLAEQKVRLEGLSKTGVAGSNANAEAFQIEQQAVQNLGSGLGAAAEAAKQHADAMKKAASDAQANATANKIAAEAIGRLANQTAGAAVSQKQYTDSLAAVSKTIETNNGTIKANNTLLQQEASTQNLATLGAQAQVLALQTLEQTNVSNTAQLKEYDAQLQSGQMQNAQFTAGINEQKQKLDDSISSLSRSQGALVQYDAQIASGAPQLVAFKQGQVDFNKSLDDTVVATAKTTGAFSAFLAAVVSGKDQIIQFDAGFASGLADVQKWGEGIAHAQGQVDGTRVGLVNFAQAVGVELPRSLNLSNDQMMKWIETFKGAPAALDAVEKAANKAFDSIVQGFTKLGQAAPKDFMKTLLGNVQDQIEKFGGILPTVTNQIASEVSKMETALEQGINRMGAELTTANLTVGPIHTQSIQNAQRDMNAMVGFLNVQFSGALRDIAPKFQPVIQDIANFANKSPSIENISKAMGGFSIVMDAAKNPTNQMSTAMLQQKLAAEGLKTAIDPTTGQIRLVGTTAATATTGVDGMGNSMTTLTANTGFAASALSALKTNFLDPLTNFILTITITANTGFAASALDALKKNFVDPLAAPITITPQVNKDPALSALGTLGNFLTSLVTTPYTITPQANTGFATSAIDALQRVVTQLVQQRYTVTVNADTSAAEQKIANLRNQLAALMNIGGAPGGAPLQSRFAASGGTFGFGVNGFEKLYAARGGSFVVNKRTNLANLTVGEGNKPELVTYSSKGLLTVLPLPKLFAAAGGQFPVFGTSPGAGVFPGTGFNPGASYNPNPSIIEYGGIPAPVQTIGQGGPQQGMPSEIGAGTILVGPGGQAQPGPVTAPGQGSLIPGGPAGPTPAQTQLATQQATMIAAQQQASKDMNKVSDLLERLISMLASGKGFNANLSIDGQRLASVAEKYIGSRSYGDL